MFENIVVAVDGSEHSNKALDAAKKMAGAFGSTVWLVHAYKHVSDLHGYNEYEPLVAKREAAGQAILDEARQTFDETAVTVEEELLEEPAAEAIITVAETRNADLIIVGSRGLGSFQGLIFGSVSNKVAQYAPCPVMIVR